MYVNVDDYLSCFSKYYTDSFAADGGSAVRAVLGNPAVREQLRAEVQRDAESKRFVYARVDSGETKIQQLHDVFFAISRNINWSGLARRWGRKVLSERFQVDETDLSLAGLMQREIAEPFVIKRRIDELLSERLLRNANLSGEFRRAMYQLVVSVLEPNSMAASATPHVLRWLNGDIEKIALVKAAFIYRRIGKTNARQMLTSLSRWLRECGYAGLVVTIDLGALMTSQKVATGHRYSRAALVDVYEVLRQFIDAIDEVEGLVVVLLADEAFADDRTRGTSIYRALHMRLSDDVWDLNRANAMAPMVRISS